MYLGKESISLLRANLSGYYAALFANILPTESEPSFRGFHDWVALRLGYYESTSGWDNMLLEAANGDETKALENFFVLLEEYKNRQARVIYFVRLPLESTPKVWRTIGIDDDAREEPPPPLIQIVKYTDDKGVFLRYVGTDDEVIEETYRVDLELAFWDAETFLKIKKEDWQSAET